MGMFVEFRFFKHEGEWERRLWVDLVPKEGNKDLLNCA